MDKLACRNSPPLNICNEREVDALAAALDCLVIDLYEAVAFVGDRPCCIRAYVERRIGRGVPAATTGPGPSEVPPVWSDHAMTRAGLARTRTPSR
jgi:hypothetical protein